MNDRADLPRELGPTFSVAAARAAGVTAGRLRAADLEHPFHGTRAQRGVAASPTGMSSFEQQRRTTIGLARTYSTRMSSTEFFSHETAAAMWGAPLPASAGHDLHVSVPEPGRAPRSRGVRGHTTRPGLAHVVVLDGLRVASPASAWATLGRLELYDLVAIGDFFVRVHRSHGYFRVNPGKPPLATIGQLEAALNAGRRAGVRNLRAALPRIRVDSWSRTETWTRLVLTDAGLPEPVLNADYFDDYGEFLGCVDLSYPEFKVAIEYEGSHHLDATRFARDIDRLDRLIEHGWRVVRVTSRHVFVEQAELVRRVRSALIARGWRP